MAGLADCRARPSYLPGDGLGFALSHRMGSEGRILAQASEARSRLSVIGSACLTTESTSAASAAAKHRCKPGVAFVFRRRRAVVLGLSAMSFHFSIEGGNSRSRICSPGIPGFAVIHFGKDIEAVLRRFHRCRRVVPLPAISSRWRPRRGAYRHPRGIIGKPRAACQNRMTSTRLCSGLTR